MKKGFTILELLVASLLLGMLMTVLTMIFNQSSISWRVGEAAITDIDDVSEGIASIHDVADNLYVWNDTSYLLTSIWEEKIRNNDQIFRQNRPLASSSGGTGISSIGDEGRNNGDTSFAGMFGFVGSEVAGEKTGKVGSWNLRRVGQGKKGDPAKLYTVNVKSAGPNKTFDDYDDIWSFPDEFD